MSRQLKFRGKREDNGEWVYGYYVCLNEKEHRIYMGYAETYYGDYYPEFFSVDPKTVGQYTGLPDINGKDIYEGDIVRHGYTCQYGDGKTTEFFNNLPVSFSNNYGGWIIGSHNILTTKNIKNYNIEVIGNIHDNPELLEGK